MFGLRLWSESFFSKVKHLDTFGPFYQGGSAKSDFALLRVEGGATHTPVIAYENE